MLSISYWLLRPLLTSPATHLALAMRVPGAVIMVATVAFWPAAARLFEVKPLAVLGRISFSLYLVRAPLVIGIGLALTDQPWWIGALITLVACPVAAIVMYIIVEKPSQHLASWTAHHVSRMWTMLAARKAPTASLPRNPHPHTRAHSRLSAETNWR
jgi:peptidoglycan/LPS O-acetylase OafA/YrhL